MISVSPLAASSLKKVCKAGLRKSESTTSTRAPVCAKVVARLAKMVDLPSFVADDVTIKTFLGSLAEVNWMFVRRERYASDTGAWGEKRVTSLDSKRSRSSTE